MTAPGAGPFSTTLVGGQHQPDWLIDRKTLVDIKIMIGCIDPDEMVIDLPKVVATRVRQALPYVKRKDAILAPDCGMKYLPRDVAFGRMKAMVEAAKLLRTELG